MTQESYRTINLFNWSGGIVGRTRNPLGFTEGALAAGENVDVADGALRTRAGTSLVSSGSLPPGEVMALANVRFPTDEVSYLVAQVKYELGWQQGSAIGPDGRDGHTAVWDLGNSRMLVFAGGSTGGLNDLWAYNPGIDAWTELLPTGGPPHSRRLHNAIYVPTSETMIVLGGQYYDISWHFLNDVWIYDCTTNTWTQQTTTGAVPPTVGQAQRYWGAYRTATDTILIGGSSHYYELNLSTWVWTSHSTTGTIPPGYFGGTAYDSDTDSIVMARAANSEQVFSHTYLLTLSSNVWTQKTDMPVAENLGSYELTAVYCSGKIHVTGDATSGSSPYLQGWTYTVAADSWSAIAWKGTSLPANRNYQSMCLSDTGNLLVFGGTVSDQTVWETTQVCEGSQVYGYGLYACPDHLPTSTGVFTKIYEFGPTCGVCKFATLNDRVVITEGLSDLPLVWGGCMDDDSSDWMHPKAVLIAQDGKTYYDISNAACDKDVDTVAQVGGIRTWGAIYICTDMPEVEGFHFEMESPNTGAAGTTSSTFHAPMKITDITDVNRQDLKGTVVNWHQDSGVTGHFTDSSGTKVTIGPGNDRGTWNGATAYVIGDTVNYNGARYWCISGNTNQTPTNTTYWLPNVPDLMPGIVIEIAD